MKRLLGGAFAASLLLAACAPFARTSAARTLDIYFIDVEGGQSTLVVTPSGESLLIDAGFPGDGTFASKPGDPAIARDAQRVLAAARDARVTQIDHLLITHFHADHFGGVMELAQLLPIREFIDHAPPSAAAETGVPGTQALYDAYAAVRARSVHRQPKPGDQFTLKGVNVTVLASEGNVLSTPLSGAGASNAACTTGGVPAQEKFENPNSTAVLLQYGAFRFLDVGDLSGAPLYALTCPINKIGGADVYLVAHHAGEDGSDPSLFRAVAPRVAIFNNGPRKGGQAPTFATVKQLGIPAFQLHRSLNPGVTNMPDAQIANLDTNTSAWIKLSANSDGSFTVTNGRTGEKTAYPKR